MSVLEAIARWPLAEPAAAAVVGRTGVVETFGPTERVVRLASVSKLLTAWATLVAVEEGTVALDGPAGPPGATVRHLLAHAAGYSFEGADPVMAPARKRGYSNTGYRVLAAHVAERTGVPFPTYVREAVCEPLRMTATDVDHDPSKGYRSNVDDLTRFAAELLGPPSLLAPATVAEATTAQFPDLDGILPGVGRFSPNPWGLGPELRGTKSPHWTGTRNSTQTFGHFGGSGTFLWVDPVAGLAVVMLATREFEEWGLSHWPALSDAVLERHATGRGSDAG